ncbi:G-protein coupled receptor 6 isoform X1 [Vulpes vulpes]|uniref:G-protein coupled receptor 6 isoform X1 n=2 Tax=Vulpes vulpes TaxID=9627 RepID=A0ABM4YWX1_VULVU
MRAGPSECSLAPGSGEPDVTAPCPSLSSGRGARSRLFCLRLRLSLSAAPAQPQAPRALLRAGPAALQAEAQSARGAQPGAPAQRPCPATSRSPDSPAGWQRQAAMNASASSLNESQVVAVTAEGAAAATAGARDGGDWGPPAAAAAAALAGGGAANASLELSSQLPAGPPGLLLSAVNPWDVLLCVSGTVIAGENALVVALIASTPALRTPMFVLVGSLATADLLAGCGLILHFVFQYVVPSETVSLLTVGFLVASFAASVSSLLAITVDRYLSLYNALTYYSRRTLLGVHLLLAATWTVSLGLGLLPVLGWNCLAERATCSVVRPLTRSHVALLSAAFFAVFGVMLHLYVRICQVVWRHAHQIALQQHCLAPPHLAATRKGVGTLAVVLGTFGASWLPFAIYCVVGSREDPAVYTYATLLPATYNSMINPIIYAFRNQEIQRALWLLFCGCFQSKVPFRSRSPSEV